jgi:hypothetical protein
MPPRKAKETGLSFFLAEKKKESVVKAANDDNEPKPEDKTVNYDGRHSLGVTNYSFVLACRSRSI